jgi:hypothetical protein
VTITGEAKLKDRVRIHANTTIGSEDLVLHHIKVNGIVSLN